ncbi:hypothetical protein [Falsiroseomonas sp. E2-1-a4]|uniref:hypothetical protein n=1 Tax=Falsiroseomonas sp. E2-1-a4 TaxID=3239299 RepID=UPI003F3C663C
MTSTATFAVPATIAVTATSVLVVAPARPGRTAIAVIPSCTVFVSPPFVGTTVTIGLASFLLGPPLIVGATMSVVAIRVECVLEHVSDIGQLEILGRRAVNLGEHQQAGERDEFAHNFFLAKMPNSVECLH